MGVVGVVHPSTAFRRTFRRGLRPHRLRTVVCRSSEALVQLYRREVVDAVVIGSRPLPEPSIAQLRASYPRVPVVVAGPFRPGDGALLGRCRRLGVAGFLVDGVDDPVAADFVATRAASRGRRRALGAAPRQLRLTEPLQVQAWEEVLIRADRRSMTGDVARALGVTREHLSREFGAGGAPNLKRVIDLARVICAADLLANPGYDARAAAKVLQFASPSHLAACARRVAGTSLAELAGLGPAEVLARFVRGRTRSRI